MNKLELTQQTRIEADALNTPSVVILRHLNRALQEFCRQTGYVQEPISMNAVAGQGVYNLPLGSGNAPSLGCRGISYQGATLTPLSAFQGTLPESWWEEEGTPEYYRMESESKFLLYPKPPADATGLENILRVDATLDGITLVADNDIPNIPAKYHMALAWKAAYELTGDEDLLALWQEEVADAKHQVAIGFDTAPVHVKPHW